MTRLPLRRPPRLRARRDPAALHAAVLMHMSEAIVAAGADGVVLFWNAAAERLFGYSAEEVVGRRVPALPDEESRRMHADALARAVAGEHVTETVLRRRRDGVVIEVHAEYSPVYAPTGEFLAVVGVLRDVTAQRSVERSLRARTELAERLQAVVVDLNSELDLSRVLWRISDSGVELLGATGAGYVLLEGDQLRVVAVSGLKVHTVGGTFPYADSALYELVRTDRTSMTDRADHYPNIPGDVRRQMHGLHTLAVAKTVVHGQVTGALYVFFDEPGRDVTQDELDVLELLAGHAGAAVANAQAYREAVRQREHERAILDAMADGMAVVDATAVVRQWNPAAEAMTGLGSEQVVGHTLPFPLPLSDGQALDHQLPNGRWIEVLVTPIAGTDERVVDFRDITQPKSLEEAKDLFLATTSHELRTPITVMKGFAETLLHRWDALGDGERQQAVQIIVQRTEALAALVEQLLLGTRAGVGALSLSLTPLDAGTALASAVAAFGHFSDRHRIELRVAPDLPPVLGDRIAFDNVVGQLLENAIKYSPDGGLVLVSAAADGGDVCITVADEGIGITAEHAEHVFDRFYQADAGNRRRFGGVGLGLYIVRQLVEAQGGRVRVVPQQRGACLELRLPTMAYRVAEVAEVAPVADPAGPAGGRGSDGTDRG